MKYNRQYQAYRGANNLLLKIVHGESLTKKIHFRYHNAVLKKLYKEFSYLINPSRYVEDEFQENSPINRVVWVMWWQGEAQAPPLVKACIDSIRSNFPNHQIVIIDEHNYKTYTNLPDVIYKRFDENIIDVTKLSNFIRMNLLFNRGGIWIDSTYFISRPLEDSIINSNFFMIKSLGKSGYRNPALSRWSSNFIIGKQGDPLFKFLQDFHISYYSQEDYLIDYQLMDYIFEIAYRENIASFRDRIDAMRITNTQMLDLRNQLNKPFSKDIAEKILLRENHFAFKLTWKQEFITSSSENPTFYMKLIDGSLTNIKQEV